MGVASDGARLACSAMRACFAGVRSQHSVARNEDDNFSWWISGKASSCFFFQVYKNTIHGDIKLKKIAGEFYWDRGAGVKAGRVWECGECGGARLRIWCK